jgi:hypothetical protein
MVDLIPHAHGLAGISIFIFFFPVTATLLVSAIMYGKKPFWAWLYLACFIYMMWLLEETTYADPTLGAPSWSDAISGGLALLLMVVGTSEIIVAARLAKARMFAGQAQVQPTPSSRKPLRKIYGIAYAGTLLLLGTNAFTLLSIAPPDVALSIVAASGAAILLGLVVLALVLRRPRRSPKR